jgi:hypothetical protein
MRAFIATNILNPLRETPTETGEIIYMDYSEAGFVVLERENDWIKVACNIDCEGCPNGELVTGWVRWRKGNELLVELYYVC